ncbi:GntR family transcriptional regulator [Actinoplanes subtropicus]|uniref:GntR family transcriptional regulator n=1 Tax=Actinoplanes subtropicus TaxID=543632 RepID=UPI0004C431E4|nr:GntR family transcriptional regulator [Actinoplanes subtropicus]
MTESKTERAYRFIKDRIEDGRFSPGYRLVLDVIAKEIQTSTVPVREAVRLLEAEQLVTFERNVGAQVAFMHEQEYRYTMQTLAVLEGAAIALSVGLIDADRIRRARAINKELSAAVTDFDPRRITELNRDFHTALFELCPNPHVLDLVHRGWKRLTLLRDSVFGFVPGRARQSVREHEALLVLLESGASPLEVEVAARGHRTNTLEAVLAYQEQHHHTAAARPA